MITQMQKNTIAKASTDINMIFKIYITSVQLGDFDIADYIEEQGYHEKFSEDQMEQIVYLLEIAEAVAELAVKEIESELDYGRPGVIIH